MQTCNTALREYQQRLFDRIHAMGGSQTASSHLGFEAGERTWVVRLTDVGEVTPVPPLVSVPLTAEWFVGVANVRGSLFAITDLGRFANALPTTVTPESRLVLLHGKYRVQAGLLVRRSLGLRQVQEVACPATVTSSWQSAPYVDTDGRTWRELNVKEFTEDERFLRVSI